MAIFLSERLFLFEMMSQSYAPIGFWADHLFNKKELIWVPFLCGFGGIDYYADTAVKVNFIFYKIKGPTEVEPKGLHC